jgi:hypothetical protein
MVEDAALLDIRLRMPAVRLGSRNGECYAQNLAKEAKEILRVIDADLIVWIKAIGTEHASQGTGGQRGDYCTGGDGGPREEGSSDQDGA